MLMLYSVVDEVDYYSLYGFMLAEMGGSPWQMLMRLHYRTAYEFILKRASGSEKGRPPPHLQTI